MTGSPAQRSVPGGAKNQLLMTITTPPGTYVLQASVSDSSINSSNYWMSIWNGYDTFQMWTNGYGSVTSNVTINVNDNLRSTQ